jgi:PPM family protein phosphatase
MVNLSGAHPRLEKPEIGPRPEPFPAGTPIGLHLRVERQIRLASDRTYYLISNRRPRWYTRKCWECGNKHSPPTAQSCTYCSAPLGPRRFLMSARWNPASSLTYQAYVHRRIAHPSIVQPVALYRYHQQLLSIYPWRHDKMLLGETAPLDPTQVLRIAFHLADALSHLHAYGTVLDRLSPGNVILSPDGTAKLFDLEVERLSDRPIPPCDDFTVPPLRDLRNMAAMLARYSPVEDEELRLFLKHTRRGAFHTADAAAGGVTQFAQTRLRDAEFGVSVAAGHSDAGIVRQLNEDDWGWRKLGAHGTLFAVADGMGGHNHGDVASALAVRSFCRHIQRQLSGDEPTDKTAPLLLAEGLAAANLAVYSLAAERRAHMGTTLAAVLLIAKGDKRSAFVGHAGDSRVYVLRDGTLIPLTEDHSMVAAMVAAGKITAAEARTHPKSNVLLSFLGSTTEFEADVSAVETKPGDRFLVCSDGLWGEVPDPAIADILGNEVDPRVAARRLVRAANDAGGGDNVTVLVVDTPW